MVSVPLQQSMSNSETSLITINMVSLYEHSPKNKANKVYIYRFTNMLSPIGAYQSNDHRQKPIFKVHISWMWQRSYTQLLVQGCCLLLWWTKTKNVEAFFLLTRYTQIRLQSISIFPAQNYFGQNNGTRQHVSGCSTMVHVQSMYGQAQVKHIRAHRQLEWSKLKVVITSLNKILTIFSDQ